MVEVAELIDLTNAISMFTARAGEDGWTWTLDSSGCFSVRSLRNHVQKPSSQWGIYITSLPARKSFALMCTLVVVKRFVSCSLFYTLDELAFTCNI
ncbi:hypothetical protein Hdeb2414_s0016g00477581 [Helianthus debilis subsp. tardiflorus]